MLSVALGKEEEDDGDSFAGGVGSSAALLASEQPPLLVGWGVGSGIRAAEAATACLLV